MAKAKMFPDVSPPGGAAIAKSSEPPPFGTPKVADTGGTVPRVVNQLERSVSGLSRYKIRCDNYPEMSRILYILASDEGSAKQCYMVESGLEKHLETLLGRMPGDVTAPVLIVVKLPD
jgi:hypothetical protein